MRNHVPRRVSNRLALSAAIVLVGAALTKNASRLCAESDVDRAEPASADLDRTRRSGSDWPCFLGPTHDGVSTETGLLNVWPIAGPPVLWQRDAGAGYSAPSVLGEQLVLHHRIGDEEIVECCEAATGATLWTHRAPSRFRDPYGYNNGPRCTPLLTPTHCYTLGAEGRLTCLLLENGKLVWERLLQNEFTIPPGFFGVGATPILEGDKLIVLVGGQPNSGVVAFDALTGQTLWENVGKSTWDGVETGWPSEPRYSWTGDEMVVSYSSPLAATIHGRRHLLCLMRQGLVSLDPESGALNFRYWFMSRVDESVNAARPLVVGDTILLGASYRVGSVCLQVAKDGHSVREAWKDPRLLSTHWSTSLYHDGCFFGFSGRHENEGQLQCVEAATGKLKWETTGCDTLDHFGQTAAGEIVDRRTGETVPWPLYGRGSATLADGHLIVLAERGTLALVKADTERWQEVSRCSVPRMRYPCWTAPVLSRGRLFLRCEDALVCLNLSSQ